MKNLLRNKAVIGLLLILEAALLIFGTVLVCDKINNERNIAAARMEFTLYKMVGSYDNLKENMGEVISEEDFSYIVKQEGASHTAELSVTQNADGSITVIEYRETNELLGGYQVHSVKVFRPDEMDEFAAYMYGTE